MVTNPQPAMQKLADFLSIEFDPILLTPTMLGQPWHGISSSNVSKQISDVPIGRFTDKLEPAIQEAVLSRLGSLMDNAGYTVEAPFVKKMAGQGSLDWALQMSRSNRDLFFHLLKTYPLVRAQQKNQQLFNKIPVPVRRIMQRVAGR